MVVSEPGMYSRSWLAHHFGLRFLSGQVAVRQNMIEKEGERGQKPNIFSQIGDEKSDPTHLRCSYIHLRFYPENSNSLAQTQTCSRGRSQPPWPCSLGARADGPGCPGLAEGAGVCAASGVKCVIPVSWLQ